MVSKLLLLILVRVHIVHVDEKHGVLVTVSIIIGPKGWYKSKMRSRDLVVTTQWQGVLFFEVNTRLILNSELPNVIF